MDFQNQTASPDAETQLLISAEGISKSFGSLQANRNIFMEVRRGEVHAVVGENGAGKSTFLKILFGWLRPDAGRILLNGKPVWFSCPGDAMRAGFGMVHQDLHIFPQLSALENVILGGEPARCGFVNWKTARRSVEGLCNAFDFSLPLAAPAGELPFANRQQIEILRVLYHKAQIVLLDEPTSLLAPPEIRKFLRILSTLKNQGHTILLVSHRLGEVMEAADRISVLRKGECVGTFSPGEFTLEQLAGLIISGPDVGSIQGSAEAGIEGEMEDRGKGPPPAVVFQMDNVRVSGDEHESGLNDFSLEVRRGEILGIGGIVGNGERTLARVIAGQIHQEAGRTIFCGRDISCLTIKGRREVGLRWLPANPQEEALVPERPLWENFLMGRQREPPWQAMGWLRRRRIRAWAMSQLDANGVVYRGLNENLMSLSGGNQQKLALSRVLEDAPRLVVLEQPGRGLDIHARESIHRRLDQLSAQGVAFLILSYDVEELLACCHRIGVLFRGRLMGIAPRGAASMETIGRWMLGLG